MIKKILFCILFVNIFSKLLASQENLLLLERCVEKSINTIHESFVNCKDGLDWPIDQTYEALDNVCGYLTDIPNTSKNFRIIKHTFEYLKDKVNIIREKNIVDKSEVIQVQADYCKLLYACFLRHDPDIHIKHFPFEKVLHNTIGEFRYYLNKYTNAFNQSFSGLIDYTSLQDTITLCLESMSDQNVHIFIPLKNEALIDSLNQLKNEIEQLSYTRDLDVNSDISIDSIYKTYTLLIEMQNYYKSKKFFRTLPLIHCSFTNQLDDDLGLIIEDNNAFKTTLECTVNIGSNVFKNYFFKHVCKVKNIISNKNIFSELYKKKIVLNYIVQPLSNMASTINTGSILCKNVPFYDIKGNVKEILKKELLIKSLEMGKHFLVSTMRTIENEASSLQLSLDKNVFDEIRLEKMLARFFMTLSIHNSNRKNYLLKQLSLIEIIFLPQIAMEQSLRTVNAKVIEDALIKTIKSLKNKDFFIQFIGDFKDSYYRDFLCQTNLLIQFLQNYQIIIDINSLLFNNLYIFLYNKKFYKLLYKESLKVKKDYQLLFDNSISAQIIIKEVILKYKKKFYHTQEDTFFETITKHWNNFLYDTDFLDQRINTLSNEFIYYGKKKANYISILEEIDIILRTINEQYVLL